MQLRLEQDHVFNKNGDVMNTFVVVLIRASDWWAEVTHGAKNGESFSEIWPKHIKLTTVDIFVVYFTYSTLTAADTVNLY